MANILLEFPQFPKFATLGLLTLLLSITPTVNPVAKPSTSTFSQILFCHSEIKNPYTFPRANPVGFFFFFHLFSSTLPSFTKKFSDQKPPFFS